MSPLKNSHIEVAELSFLQKHTTLARIQAYNVFFHTKHNVDANNDFS